MVVFMERLVQDAWLLHPFHPKAGLVLCTCVCSPVHIDFFGGLHVASFYAGPLSRFDNRGKAKELYQQLPDWVRPGSVATCLAFELPGLIESISFSTTKASAFLVHIEIHKVQPGRRGDSTSNIIQQFSEAYWWSTSQHRVLPVQIRDVCSRTRQAGELKTFRHVGPLLKMQSYS